MVLKLPAVMSDGSVMLLERHITEIPYVANTLVTAPAIRLRPNLLKKFVIHVRVQAEPSLVGNPIIQDYPWRLIRHITIRSVRNEVLKTVDARSMYWLNTYETGTSEFSDFPNTSPLAVPIDNTFDLCIPFDNITGINPEKTILNLNEFTELYVDILWDDTDNIYNEVLENAFVTATIVALEREPINLSDELEPRLKLIDQVYRLPIESDHLEFLLPENTFIKTIQSMITQPELNNRRIDESGTAGQTIANLSIEDDDNAHSLREWSGKQIQSSNKSYYGLEVVPAGIWTIEFDQLRDFTTLYKTYGRNYPKIKFDFSTSQDIPQNPANLDLLIRQVATPPPIAIPV